MPTHPKPLAALLPALFAVSPVHGQQASLDTVVVTATRFDETGASSAANVTVISREEIEASAAELRPVESRRRRRRRAPKAARA